MFRQPPSPVPERPCRRNPVHGKTAELSGKHRWKILRAPPPPAAPSPLWTHGCTRFRYVMPAARLMLPRPYSYAHPQTRHSHTSGDLQPLRLPRPHNRDPLSSPGTASSPAESIYQTVVTEQKRFQICSASVCLQAVYRKDPPVFHQLLLQSFRTRSPKQG